MADQDPNQQELEDELTAYLDGELGADDVRRVEDRLARDADYRGQLQQLERAWNLLDRLPRAEVGEQFTNTTLEMVAVSAAEDAEAATRQRPRVRQRQRLAGLISLAAALLVGFAIGSQVWPDPNEKLLENLPVLENLDLYYQVDDVEFLRMLDREHLFEDGDSEHAP
jgi:anti-sigma factor RsiW